MPICCICGKKTLNCFIKDRKAYCKSCLKVAGMDSGSIMSRRLMSASEDDIRNAVSEGTIAKTLEEAKILSEFIGNFGKIELYNDKIVIKRGIMHPNGRSQKEIYLSSITAIHIKEPGLQAGYIQFVVLGSHEVRQDAMMMNIAEDENSVIFNGKTKYNEALAFKSRIEELKKASHQPTVIVQNQLSNADEIKKYKELLDMGAITEEEFVAKKKQLLEL